MGIWITSINIAHEIHLKCYYCKQRILENINKLLLEIFNDILKDFSFDIFRRVFWERNWEQEHFIHIWRFIMRGFDSSFLESRQDCFFIVEQFQDRSTVNFVWLSFRWSKDGFYLITLFGKIIRIWVFKFSTDLCNLVIHYLKQGYHCSEFIQLGDDDKYSIGKECDVHFSFWDGFIFNSDGVYFEIIFLSLNHLWSMMVHFRMCFVIIYMILLF